MARSRGVRPRRRRASPARSGRCAATARLGRAAALGLGLVALTVCSLPGPASADIRQHVLGSQLPDIDTMLTELTATMRGAGFQVTTTRDETRTVPADNRSITYRQVEYQFYHQVDYRNITVSLFLLVEPEREDFEPLRNYVQTNPGYTFVGNAALRVRGVGFLAWAEWSSSGVMTTDTLDKELADWRATYLEVE